MAAAAWALAAGGQSEWVFEPCPGAGSLGDILYDVDGTAEGDAWAVGRSDFGPSFFEPPDFHLTIALHWDGTGWEQVSTPNPGAYWNMLAGVKALAPDDAWAAGSLTNENFGIAQALAMHWDGTSWTHVATPVIGGGSVAWAIDGAASDDLWIVGERGGGQALALHWTGTSFDALSLPPAGNERNQLHAVAVLAPDDVWAVGDHENFGVQETSKPLFMRYNGSFWTIHLASFLFGQLSVASLSGLAAVGPDDLWAVGWHSVAGEGTQPLIMHYDGTSWSMVALPIVPEGPAELRAVDAHGPLDIWAAGTHATSEGVPRPLIMRYDGSGWSVPPAAESGGSHEWFRGVAALPGGETWAVGQYYDGTLTTTLTQRRPAVLSVPGDIDGDGAVGVEDLVALITAWGACPIDAECPADLNGDGVVDVADLVSLIVNWG
jgi:hypothetical protein